METDLLTGQTAVVISMDVGETQLAVHLGPVAADDAARLVGEIVQSARGAVRRGCPWVDRTKEEMAASAAVAAAQRLANGTASTPSGSVSAQGPCQSAGLTPQQRSEVLALIERAIRALLDDLAAQHAGFGAVLATAQAQLADELARDPRLGATASATEAGRPAK